MGSDDQGPTSVVDRVDETQRAEHAADARHLQVGDVGAGEVVVPLEVGHRAQALVEDDRHPELDADPARLGERLRESLERGHETEIVERLRAQLDCEPSNRTVSPTTAGLGANVNAADGARVTIPARAKETEVRPGFTKAEMTRVTKDDPRAAGGLFERIGGLLAELI